MECDGNKEVNGNSDKGGEQATAMATKRAMVTAMRVAGNKKAMAVAANSNEGGGRAKRTRKTAMATAMATVALTVRATAMVTAMAMATATATETAIAMAIATATATAMATAVAILSRSKS